ncbi:uncharacterized protein PRCAT00005484001 [Priceomyces carsonii]|uniref:uncharacterized protein n=1 Tax=Priceomyces carsonii TaxID=28549 RepID=UPI002EDB09C2|nr:unnamed protein product [Priceomyces carsonii]
MTNKKTVQHSISRFFKASQDQEPEPLDLSHGAKSAVEKLTHYSNKKKSTNHTFVPKIKASDHTSNHNEESTDTVAGKGVTEIKSNKRPNTASDHHGNVYTKTRKRTKLTPLETQVAEFKELHKDKLLIFQVGYKYKLFGEDAKVGSKILNISYILDENDSKFSYCSFPVFKLHINLKRLLVHGFKIGVIKQAETAIVKSTDKSSSPDLMKRKLTGVYTKGTYMNDEVESEGQHSINLEENQDYIVCINESNENEFSMVAVNPLTGDVIYDSFKDALGESELERRLSYMTPSEVLILCEENERIKEIKRIITMVSNEASIICRSPKDYAVSSSQLREYFKEINNGESSHLIDYYTVNYSRPVQACINELILYLSEFKLSAIFNIPSNISSFSDSKRHMLLSSDAIRALEIFQNYTYTNCNKGSLLWLLDHTRTRFGTRLLRKWISRPLINKIEIEERYQAIDDLRSGFNHAVDSLKIQLDKIGKNLDLEEMLMKVHLSSSYKTGKISRNSVYSMLECFANVLKTIQTFHSRLMSLENTITSPLLLKVFEGLRTASRSNVVFHLQKMINPSFQLSNYKDINEQKMHFFNQDYYNWEDIAIQKEMISKYEALLQDELKEIQKYLKRPQLKFVTNKNEAYLVEIRNTQVDTLPKGWQKVSGTTTVSRFRTPEVIRLYKLLQYHNEMLLCKCDEAYWNYLNQINNNYQFFQNIIKELAILDCLFSFKAASELGSNVRPHLVDEQIINVTNSRNPIIENLSHGRNYVSNNINMAYDERRVLIITGPNMGGKSSYVKQIALLVIMAQIGCFIPCESATMGIFDSIFIRMGASDNILKKESTFMTEMLECSNIVKNVTKKSLIILDEIGRGTGTSDGIALAYSILKFFIDHSLKPLILFITHYPSLHTLEDEYGGIVKNYHMGYIERSKSNQKYPDILFLYTVVQGVVSSLYGLNVARLAGLPDSVISNAFQVSEEAKSKTELEFDERLSVNFIKILKDLQNERPVQLDILQSLLGFI